MSRFVETGKGLVITKAKAKESVTDSVERIMKAMPAPVITVNQAPITVNLPDHDPAPVNVNVQPAPVTVNIPDAAPINVNVTLPSPGATETVVEEHDDKGRIKRTVTRPVE